MLERDGSVVWERESGGWGYKCACVCYKERERERERRMRVTENNREILLEINKHIGRFRLKHT